MAIFIIRVFFAAVILSPALLSFAVLCCGVRLDFNVSEYDNVIKHHSNSTNFGAMFTKYVKMGVLAQFWPFSAMDMARL
jgi:hypothetical protein